MGETDVTVEFNENFYYPGQFVGGKIVLTLPNRTVIRVIKLKFSGKAKCRNRNYAARSAKSSKEQYLSTKVIVAGDDGDFSLDAGKHEYLFSVKLPLIAPATFYCTNGFVTYYVECKLRTVDSSEAKKVKFPFTVNNVLNLNFYPQLMARVKREDQRYSTGCCRSYPTSLTVALPQSGFVFNQRIPICVDVDNAKKEILGVTCSLNAIARLSIPKTGMVFLEKRLVKARELGKVNRYSVESWETFLDTEGIDHIVVLNSNIIQTYYEIETIAKLENGSILKVSIPIIIGDYPYDPVESQTLLNNMKTIDQNDSKENKNMDDNVENSANSPMVTQPKESTKTVYKYHYSPIYLPNMYFPTFNVGPSVIPIPVPRDRSSSHSSSASSISWSTNSSKSSHFSIPDMFQNDETCDSAIWCTIPTQVFISNNETNNFFNSNDNDKPIASTENFDYGDSSWGNSFATETKVGGDDSGGGFFGDSGGIDYSNNDSGGGCFGNSGGNDYSNNDSGGGCFGDSGGYDCSGGD